jgi:hypothetical protein
MVVAAASVALAWPLLSPGFAGDQLAELSHQVKKCAAVDAQN